MASYKALSDGNILIHIPLRFAHTSNGARMMSDEPGANYERNSELANIQSVALGTKYRNMVLYGGFASRGKLARHLGVDGSYLARMLRLGFLSPIIVEKLVKGELPQVSAQQLQRLQTLIWTEQHKQLDIK